MKKITILLLLLSVNTFSMNTTGSFDNFNVGLKYLYGGQFLEAYYEFNFIITRLPNFHLNAKSNYYAATCLRYFGQFEESSKYLDSSDAFAGIPRDNDPNPFVWLARSDTIKALSCFKNIENYPYNFIFSKYFNRDPDLIKFVCLINCNTDNLPNKKVYINIGQKYKNTSKKYNNWKKYFLIDPQIKIAFEEIVLINMYSADATSYEVKDLKDLMALLIAKALYYNSIEDYSRCANLCDKIILSYPYLFPAQTKKLPDDIMEQISSQNKRISLLKSLPSHKALEDMINKKRAQFIEIGKITFMDGNVDSMFQNLLIVVLENNKHLKEK